MLSSSSHVVDDVFVLEVVVFAPRRAVGDQDGGCVERFGLDHELDDVLVKRHDREAVFLSGVTVGHLREVQLQVERALDGGRDAVFLARLDDPLPDDAIARDVLLDGVGAIRVAIALDEVERGFARVDA
jgi:hypothetical protein